MHMRCADCGCFIGEKHMEKMPVVIGGRNLCRACANWERTMMATYGQEFTNTHRHPGAWDDEEDR